MPLRRPSRRSLVCTSRVRRGPLLATALLASLFTASGARADITTGLVAHFTFEDGSGSVAADATGNGNDGNLVNGPAWTLGHIGQGLSLNGTDQYVALTTANGLPVFSPALPHSISFWVKATSGAAYAESGPASLSFQAAGQSLQVYLALDGAGVLNRYASAPAFDGTWHHVVWVDNLGAAKVYVDGVDTGTTDATSPTFDYPASGSSIPTTALLGAIPDGGGGFYAYLKGTIDEVRAYDRALSPADVLELTTQPGANPPAISEVFPTGTLPFYYTAATVQLTTDAASMCRYSSTPDTDYDQMTGTFESVTNRKHIAVVKGFTAGTSNAVYVRCEDAAGNQNTADHVVEFSIAAAEEPLVDLIPASRLVDWIPGVTVGVPGGIPRTRTNLIDVTQPPYSADKSGATDAAAAINAAVEAAVEEDVVYLPEGTYRIDTGIGMGPTRPNITLRGAGMDTTIIDCRSPNGCMGLGGGGYSVVAEASITGGLEKGSTELTVGDASLFTVGRIAKILLANDPNKAVVSVASFPELAAQQVMITATTATTVSVSPPLYGDYSRLFPRLVVIADQTNFVGFEDLTLDASNGTAQVGIGISQCYGCWVDNVKIRHPSNYALALGESLHCEVRRSYLDEQLGTGSNHAGLLMGAASACLIEDNIIYKFFPHMEINAGCSGNVFAYNFTDQNAVDPPTYMGAYINSNHAPHNQYNLFEGNIAALFESDGYFGGESDETLFRNWLYGADDVQNTFVRALQLNRFSRNFSVIGNVLGRTNDKNGAPMEFSYDNSDGNGTWGGAGGTRILYMLGLPNIGNGGFNGAYAQISQGQPWAEWSSLLTSAWGGGPGSGSSQELDLDVPASTILKANWNAADKGIRASESIGDATLKDSLYRGCKPSWYGDLTWPAFDPNNPNESYDAIPAGYRFVHKTAVPGATTDPDPCVPGAPPPDEPSSSASSTTGGEAAGDDGGCGCRIVQATEIRWPFAAAALLGFGAALRRRQRRRGSLRADRISD